LAQKSRLNKVHQGVKFWSVLALIFLSVVSRTPVIGFMLFLLMLIFIVMVGGLDLQEYLSLLCVPVSFLILSGLALLFEYNVQSVGVINLPFFQGYLTVSRLSQQRAALVMAKALGAISCLYLLSLTTTMSEIIGLLRRIHVPDIVIELMYLIYRYIFILLEMYRSMKDAAKSRLGFIDFTTGLRTTGHIYANLLARSYRKADANFNAMESRCYMGEISFLENKKRLTPLSLMIAVYIVGITFCFTLALPG
jgi:cobalt ABC transporter, permease protein CbiQ